MKKALIGIVISVLAIAITIFVFSNGYRLINKISTESVFANNRADFEVANTFLLNLAKEHTAHTISIR